MFEFHSTTAHNSTYSGLSYETLSFNYVRFYIGIQSSMSDRIHIQYDVLSHFFLHASNKMCMTHNSCHKSNFPIDSKSQTLRYNDMAIKVIHLPEPGQINRSFKQLQVYDMLKLEFAF
jgi:hypothetical protein